MKNLNLKITIFIFLTFLFVTTVFSQNVGINQLNPDPSALLDITATDMGLLIPRVTLNDINTTAPITAPAEGLLIYNETGTEPHGFYYWDGSIWVQFSAGGTGTDDQNLTGSTLTGTSLQIDIENGASTTVDLSFLQDGIGTDDQNISGSGLSGTTLTIGIEDGSSQTVDLSSLTGTGTDDQNLTGATITGTNLQIDIENGGSTTVDLSSLQDGIGTDDQNISGSGLSGTILTIGIEGGSNETVDLSSLAGGSGWDLTGNAGTVDGTNFIGTTDNIPFNFRINNEKAGRITTDNTFYGHLSGNSITSGINNVFNGDDAGYSITTGGENVFLGHRVGYYMQTGVSNTALGYNALYNYGGSGSGVHPGGSGNVAIGKWAMFNPISGDYNVAVGYSTYSLVNTGSDNVFIGRYADVDSDHATSFAVALGAFSSADADYATALGYRAYANTANTLILGQIDGVNGATSNTNVGIGTTVPIKRLHIIGDDGTTEDVVLEDNGGAFSYLHFCIRNSTGTGSMSYGFSQQTGNSHFAGIDLDPDNEQLIIRNNYCTTNGFDNGVITFVTRNASGSAERARIDNDGNLGVGTANVRSKLDVAGGVGIGDGDGISITHGANNSIQINTDMAYGGTFDEHSGYLMYSTMSVGWAQSELIFACSTDWGVYNTASPALKINQTACTMHGVAITSDRRLKTDIKDINYGLTALMKMKPVAYKKHTATEIIKGKVKLEDKGIDRVGFIAQDLYEIIPEVVFKPENSDKDFWSIDYSKISVIAVKAIQEQQKVIEQQQKDILKLTKQNDRILKLLEELMNDKETGR